MRKRGTCHSQLCGQQGFNRLGPKVLAPWGGASCRLDQDNAVPAAGTQTVLQGGGQPGTRRGSWAKPPGRAQGQLDWAFPHVLCSGRPDKVRLLGKVPCQWGWPALTPLKAVGKSCGMTRPHSVLCLLYHVSGRSLFLNKNQ